MSLTSVRAAAAAPLGGRARLIEACGWKGHRAGDVGVWPRHALVLVNYGGGSGRQVLDMARRIADSVAQRFDVALDMEPTVLGED